MRSLVIFFEGRFSLVWANNDGLLERNLALFRKLLERGTLDQVYFYTHDPRDLALLRQCHEQGRLPEGIKALPAPQFATSKLGGVIYSLVGPVMHRKQFREAIALHTHQVSGAFTAVIGKALFRTPLLFRCGYPLSVRFKQERRPIHYVFTRLLEKILMHMADHVGVTSSRMQKYYGQMRKAAQITIMPNYVDISTFSPVPSYDPNQPVVTVGRLVEVKNLENIILACSRLNLTLHIYGKGPLEASLRKFANECNADVCFMGVVSNLELAKLHHNYSVFLNCSTREGLPKAVVEAMASGLIIIGTRTDGVLELVEDGKTGHLVDGFDANAIEEKLRWVRDNFSPEVGRAAARFVTEHYSLEHATNVTEMILKQIERKV